MLAAIDKLLAPLSWVAAAALAVMLFVGPVVVADDKESAATPRTPAGASPYAEPSTTPAPAASADGKQLFIDNCGSCHTLSKAGTSGASGPNLDESAPDAATVEAVMVSGSGVMPSFADALDEEERAAIAAYVAG